MKGLRFVGCFTEIALTGKMEIEIIPLLLGRKFETVN